MLKDGNTVKMLSEFGKGVSPVKGVLGKLIDHSL